MSGIHLFVFQLLFELMISNCFDMDNTIEATDAIFVLICSHKVGSHVVWFPNQKEMAWEPDWSVWISHRIAAHFGSKGVRIRVHVCGHYNLHDDLCRKYWLVGMFYFC